MKNLSTRALAQIALLIALEIILNRFLAIPAPVVRTINFAFLPIALIAILHGPILAGTAAALADILGFFLFPAGPWGYLPGFTLSAFVTGFIFGIFLHNNASLTRIVLAVMAVTVVVRMGLNILWLVPMFGDAFIVLLPPRILGALLMAPIQIICIRVIASERILPLFTGGRRPAMAE